MPDGCDQGGQGRQDPDIDRMLCIQCGYCAESCPKKCLTIVPGYTEPGAEKVTDVIQIPEKPKEETQ